MPLTLTFPNDLYGMLATDHGCHFDGVTDDLAALQAIIDALSAAGGGRVLCPNGTAMLSNTLKVKNKVRVSGVAKRATTLKANGSFPTSTPVVQLGAGTTGFAFDSRVEDLTIEANNVAGSTCLFSSEGQEGSGARNCLMSNFAAYAIDFGNGGTGPIANTILDELELYTTTTGATGGIRYNSLGGGNICRAVTFSAASGGTPYSGANRAADGIYITAATVHLDKIHGEGCVDVLDCDTNSAGFANNVDASGGGSTVTNVVHLRNGTWQLAGLTRGTATNILTDDFVGAGSLTDNFLPSYLSFNNQIGVTRQFSQLAAPTTGTWRRGDIVWNWQPSAGGAPGWICTTAGSPGTWKAMANVAA